MRYIHLKAIMLYCLFLWIPCSIGWQQDSSYISRDKAPPPTLVSGEVKTEEITGKELVHKSRGHFKLFRYGTISKGSVQVDVTVEQCEAFLIIINETGKLLEDKWIELSHPKVTIALDVNAGETIQIIVGGRSLKERGTFKLRVIEKNRAKGEIIINDAIHSSQALLADSKKAQEAGNLDQAFKLIHGALDSIIEVPGHRQSDPAIEFLKKQLGRVAYQSGALETALDAWTRVKRYYEEILPPDSIVLQQINLNIGVIFLNTGNFDKAEPILDDVVTVFERVLPEDHHHLQIARMNYAQILKEKGRLEEARTLLNKILATYERTLPSDHESFLKTKINFAHVIMGLGDHGEARKILEEVVIVLEKTRPDDDLTLLDARLNLASCLRVLEESFEAHALLVKVYDAYRRIYSSDHPSMTSVLFELAVAKKQLGEVFEARSILEELVVLEKQRHDPDHPHLQLTRMALAETMSALGDPWGALELYEDVLEVFKRIYSNDHQDLQRARIHMASVLYALDEFKDAKGLLETAIKYLKRTHPPHNSILQNARMNLAVALFELGENQEARTLMETVLENYQARGAIDIRHVQSAKRNYARILWEQGNFQRALDLLQEDLDICEHELPSDDLDLQVARGNLAAALMVSGDHARSSKLVSKALNCGSSFLTRIATTSSVREVGEALGKFRWILNHCLSLAYLNMIPASDCFKAAEAFRSAGARTGRTCRLIAREGGDEVRRLQNRLINASQKVAAAKREEIIDAVRARDLAEAELRKAVMRLPSAINIYSRTDPKDIAKNLPEGWAGLSYQRYLRMVYPENGEIYIQTVPSYLVFILFPNGAIEYVPLEAAGLIEDAVTAWRESLVQRTSSAAQQTGRDLKRLIWKPVADKLGNIRKVVIAPDSMLAMIPFEALPEKNAVLADEFTIAYLDALSTLTIEECGSEVPGTLVTFGGIDYDSTPILFKGKKTADHVATELDELLSISRGSRPLLRGSFDRNLPHLPVTSTESKILADMYSKFHTEKPLCVEGSEASKESLIALASRARYLHIATHGFYACEKYSSIDDPDPVDKDHFYATMDMKVRGVAPSLLCGLALAGCNQPRSGFLDQGVISAEEVQALDLSRCELVVLSACDTNVGLARSGQGIMAMQRALGIAGTRGSITSLWKVDDLATCLLFLKFYEYLWKDHLTPVDALQNAKHWLRNLTLEEVSYLNEKISTSGERGLSQQSTKPFLGVRSKPFSPPFYWASFVYWGALE